jgi:hypothetical protein
LKFNNILTKINHRFRIGSRHHNGARCREPDRARGNGASFRDTRISSGIGTVSTKRCLGRLLDRCNERIRARWIDYLGAGCNFESEHPRQMLTVDFRLVQTHGKSIRVFCWHGLPRRSRTVLATPKKSFFQLYCEEVFTTEDTKSTKERRFNRKEAKGRKEFAFQICGGAPGGCPFEDANSPRSPRHLESEVSETFVSFVLSLENRKGGGPRSVLVRLLGSVIPAWSAVIRPTWMSPDASCTPGCRPSMPA